VRRGGELAHVQPNLGDDDLGGMAADPGDLVQAVYYRQGRGQQLAGVGSTLALSGWPGTDPATSTPAWRVAAAPPPGPGAGTGRGGTDRDGCLLDQRLDHGPTGDAQDVGGHRGKLAQGVLG
jgi:hypothetical protein